MLRALVGFNAQYAKLETITEPLVGCAQHHVAETGELVFQVCSWNLFQGKKCAATVFLVKFGDMQALAPGQTFPVDTGQAITWLIGADA